MILHKLYIFLFVAALVFQTTAFAAPTQKVKRAELTPELKQKAVELLSSVGNETAQFSLAENRVRAGTIVADLMWEHDESAARAIYQTIFAELKNMFGQIKPLVGEEATRNEQTRRFQDRYKLAELRKEYVLTLAAHDSQAALASLVALKTKLLEESYDPLRPNDLELELAAAIAKKDPEKAYALAKEQLAAEGVTNSFVESLKNLHGKNSRLAADLGKDVLAKIKNAKIRVPSAGSSRSSSETNAPVSAPTSSKQSEIDFWQAANFINAASEMNRRAARDKEKKMLPLLADAEMREACDLIARAYLNERRPVLQSIGQIMPEIIQYAPAQAQRIRSKIGAEGANEFDKFVEANSYYFGARKEKSFEELALDADRAAPDIRDQRYIYAANKALEEGEPEKAKEIAARIKDRRGYGFLFEQIEAALPLAKARRGDSAEVRKMLAALKTDHERIDALTELASAVAAKGDKETAKNLLDESLQMLPAPLKKHPDLQSAEKIAAAYSVVEPEHAFAIVENSIAQMNEYISAGIRLGKFFDVESIENGELLYDSVNRKALQHAPNSAVLLKNLARADFKRTVALADKFTRPEIRLLVRMRIAQALLKPEETSEKDKKMLERIKSEDEYH
jgi:hypothetical protein